MALRANIGANVANLAANSLIVVISIPVLTRALGVHDYASWIVISTIPALLVMSDLGLSSAGSVRMTELFVTDRKCQARTLLKGYSAVVLVLVAMVSFTLEGALTASSAPALQSLATNLAMAAWVVMAIGSSLLEGAFRATNRFATGIIWVSAIRIFETAVLWLVALSTRELQAMALSQFAARAVGTGVMMMAFQWRTRGISGWSDAASVDWLEVKRLWRPSLGFLAGPAGQLLMIQGSTLIAASLFTSAGLVLFNTARIFAGLVRQIGQAIGFAFLPELTRSGALNDHQRSAHLIRRLTAVLLVTLAPICIVLIAAGAPICERLTGLTVPHLAMVIGLLVVYALGETAWTAFLVLRMSVNSHFAPALVQLLAACLAMLTALGLAHVGPVGLASAFAGYGILIGAVGYRISRGDARLAQ